MSKKHKPTTEIDILKEVSEELNIDFEHCYKIYKYWVAYLKFIAESTEQTYFFFKYIGTAYFSFRRRKGRKEFMVKKPIDRKDFNKNRSWDWPVIVFYGLNNKNKETDKRYTLQELSEIQRKKFKQEHDESLENIKI